MMMMMMMMIVTYVWQIVRCHAVKKQQSPAGDGRLHRHLRNEV